MKAHHYHSAAHRAFYCFILVAFILFVGTLVMHRLEGFDYVDAFYFTSMIATGQGPAPNLTPVTATGKLFTSFLAFISVGVMVASLGFLFGPFLGKLFKVGVMKIEEEWEFLKKKNHHDPHH